jgi:hypothetical protein
MEFVRNRVVLGKMHIYVCPRTSLMVAIGLATLELLQGDEASVHCLRQKGSASC